MYAYMLWADTTAGIMKMRNGANSAWISLWELDGTFIATDISLSAGTAGAPSLYFTGDTNTGLFSPGADTVALATAGSNRLHITSAGLVGIGTTSPSSTLTVGGNPPIGGAIAAVGAAAGIALALSDNTNSSLYVRTASNGAIIGTDTGGILRFATNGNAVSDEKARITADGKLLVGTSTARSNFFNSTNSAIFQIEGFADASLTRTANDQFASSIIFAKTRSTGNTIVQNNDIVGLLSFQGSDGSEFVECASITGNIDGTPGANDMPGRLVFSTTADGASTPTERMRITSAGDVAINCTGLTGDAPNVAGSFYASTNGNMKVRVSTDGIPAFQFYSPTGGTSGPVGSIVVNASSTSYSTSSDYRLKENVTAFTDGITRLQQLKPSRFNFITDPTKTVDGFIAHEVQSIVPEAITGEKDAVDDEDNSIYQGIDQSKLVPLLTAALQEAIAKIEALETRLSALEGA
jgi:hypothetical protein